MSNSLIRKKEEKHQADNDQGDKYDQDPNSQ